MENTDRTRSQGGQGQGNKPDQGAGQQGGGPKGGREGQSGSKQPGRPTPSGVPNEGRASEEDPGQFDDDEASVGAGRDREQDRNNLLQNPK